MQGEGSTDEEVAVTYPEDPAKIITESGYTKKQIFNADKIILLQKVSSKTSLAREEKSIPGFKPSKDRLTLLSGAQAAGDLKLKPVFIYHSENHKALQKYAKTTLSVLYKCNNEVWMTAHLFTPRLLSILSPWLRLTAQRGKKNSF